MKNFLYSKSKRFVIACFSFLFGISIASITQVHIPVYIIVACLLVAMSFLIIFWDNVAIFFIVLCGIICFLAIVRYTLAFPTKSLPEEQVLLHGYISAEPDIRQGKVNYLVTVQQQLHNSRKEFLGQQLYVPYDIYPRFAYGDVVELRCKTKQPEALDTFRYDMYLARMGVFSVCQQAHLRVIDSGKGNIFFRFLFTLKEGIAEKINLLWHEPYAGFMAGLLYGYRGGLGSLNELFAITGVTHIIAISGYNITLVANILMGVCVYLHIKKQQAFWLMSIGIVVFVLFAGASASVVRAGIMGIIVLVANRLGRASSIGPTLILCAVLMNIHNPFVLIWDAGFQLSFLATVGLVYIVPLIDSRINLLNSIAPIKESFITTFSATIATLPLILYQFGRLSVVALVVNMLVLWILPFSMMMGVLAVFFSFLYAPLAQICSWIAWGMMAYVVEIVTFFANIPFASIDLSISIWVMLVAYISMGYIIYKKSFV